MVEGVVVVDVVVVVVFVVAALGRCDDVAAPVALPRLAAAHWGTDQPTTSTANSNNSRCCPAAIIHFMSSHVFLPSMSFRCSDGVRFFGIFFFWLLLIFSFPNWILLLNCLKQNKKETVGTLAKEKKTTNCGLKCRLWSGRVHLTDRTAQTQAQLHSALDTHRTRG